MKHEDFYWIGFFTSIQTTYLIGAVWRLERKIDSALARKR